MRRRDLLVGALGTATAGALALPRSARAIPWATAPEEAQPALLPQGVRAEKCLEVFCYGGIAPFESFYVVEEYGRPEDPDYPNQGWYLFSGQHDSVFGNLCGLPRDQWLQEWQTDGNGMSVKLGPMVQPLRERPDVLSRMRVFVLRHDLEPHEAAIPYMLSGMRLGNIRMAGMGAHVQRYFQDRDLVRTTPHAYVFTPNTEINTDNLRASTAVGQHPGAARPLDLRISNSDRLSELLSRPHLGANERADMDRLLGLYAQRSWSRHSTLDLEPLRARGIEDHDFALRALARAPELLDVFGDGLLAPVSGSACNTSDSLDHTRVGIRAASRLLSHPTAPARYVNVIDGGMIVADGGGGYDTHFSHPDVQAINGTSMLRNLMEVINEPGEGDSSKIDLDETMVLITTEFGRTPFLQFAQGTNHHPYGYIVVMLGGPIGPEQSGLYGTLGPDGNAVDFLTPAEFRAACLAAMGFYPFSQESFAVGDIRGINSELEGLQWLNQDVLGRSA